MITTNPASQPSLQVVLENQIVFTSDGKWLYPLFNLEDFLRSNPFAMDRAFVRDKVIGKAAALLLIRLGARRMHGELMSTLAVQALTRFDITHSYDKLVDRIDCKTESLLLEVDVPEEAYRILCRRAKRC